MPRASRRARHGAVQPDDLSRTRRPLFLCYANANLKLPQKLPRNPANPVEQDRGGPPGDGAGGGYCPITQASAGTDPGCPRCSSLHERELIFQFTATLISSETQTHERKADGFYVVLYH